jgi:4,5-DOPA dioxygenase extradiol
MQSQTMLDHKCRRALKSDRREADETAKRRGARGTIPEPGVHYNELTRPGLTLPINNPVEKLWKDRMMEHNRPENKGQIVYFSHGGGPLPILGDASHRAMVEFMRRLPLQLIKPDVILVISAHWEESAATVLGAQNPAMFYDYYGFPDEAYEITYPAPGSPELANKIVGLLKENNIPTKIDLQRGFDHGLFIPLKLMYPKADIPSIQLSLVRGLSPGVHIALGRALRGLMDENILVIGSGFSFHNLRAFTDQGNSAPDPANDAFQNWLIEVCAGQSGQPEREKRLIEWETAPFARYCHPREEHLLPVHVCLGMAGKRAQVIFDDQILGKRSIAVLWRWENQKNTSETYGLR